MSTLLTMLRATNYQNRPLFHGAIQKINVSQKTCHFYFLNKSVKQSPILIISGTQHYQ